MVRFLSNIFPQLFRSRSRILVSVFNAVKPNSDDRYSLSTIRPYRFIRSPCTPLWSGYVKRAIFNPDALRPGGGCTVLRVTLCGYVVASGHRPSSTLSKIIASTTTAGVHADKRQRPSPEYIVHAHIHYLFFIRHHRII